MDNIIYKPQHYLKADIIARIADTMSKSDVITIGGSAGTGKTEIALLIQEVLPEYEIVRLDRFYRRNRADREFVRREDIGTVGIPEMNWEAINILLDSMDKVIVEGLYANFLPADFKVHLEGTTKETYEFRKERMKEDPDDEFRKKVVEREHKVVEKLREKAHLKLGWEVPELWKRGKK